MDSNTVNTQISMPSRSINEERLKSLDDHINLMEEKLEVERELFSVLKTEEREVSEGGGSTLHVLSAREDRIDSNIRIIDLQNKIKAQRDHLESIQYKTRIDEKRYEQIAEDMKANYDSLIEKYNSAIKQLPESSPATEMLKHLFESISDGEYIEGSLDAYDALKMQLNKF